MVESSLNVVLPNGEIQEFIGYCPQGKPKVLRSNRKPEKCSANSFKNTPNPTPPQSGPSKGPKGPFQLFGSLRMISSQLRDKMGA